MVAVIALLPRLTEQMVSNVALVTAFHRTPFAVQLADSVKWDPRVVPSGEGMANTAALWRARGIYDWMNGDIANAETDLWAALDAYPSDRAFLSLMGFYNRTDGGTLVPTHPLILSGEWNLEFESLSPLVVSRFAQNPEKGNYLQYHRVAMQQGWSRVLMSIRGQVLYAHNSGCDLYPRIVFWNSQSFLHETEVPYPVRDQFAVDYWITPPPTTTHFTPRISLDDPCLAAGQKIRIDSVTLYPEQ